MSRTADRPARDRPARPGNLNGLVGRLSHTERDALAALHRTLTPEVAANLWARLPDQGNLPTGPPARPQKGPTGEASPT